MSTVTAIQERRLNRRVQIDRLHVDDFPRGADRLYVQILRINAAALLARVRGLEGSRTDFQYRRLQVQVGRALDMVRYWTQHYRDCTVLSGTRLHTLLTQLQRAERLLDQFE